VWPRSSMPNSKCDAWSTWYTVLRVKATQRLRLANMLGEMLPPVGGDLRQKQRLRGLRAEHSEWFTSLILPSTRDRRALSRSRVWPCTRLHGDFSSHQEDMVSLNMTMFCLVAIMHPTTMDKHMRAALVCPSAVFYHASDMRPLSKCSHHVHLSQPTADARSDDTRLVRSSILYHVSHLGKLINK
jgi:hypothetical protein